METVKVSSKGQVVIPKSLRDSHRIHTGDSFIITAVGNELHLKPMPAAGQSSLKSVAGMLHRPGTRKLSDKQLEQRISARLRDEDRAENKDGVKSCIDVCGARRWGQTRMALT